MKIPHALSVEAGPERYVELLAALGAGGLRFGWLEWPQPETEPEPLPEPLRQAAAAGALRAVAVGRRLTVAVKSRQGPPVVRDLVREHFRGCAVVFVRGGRPGASVTLRAEAGGWSLTALDGAATRYDSASLVERLRSPRTLLRRR